MNKELLILRIMCASMLIYLAIIQYWHKRDLKELSEHFINSSESMGKHCIRAMKSVKRCDDEKISNKAD